MNIFHFISNPGSVFKKWAKETKPEDLQNGAKTIFMWGVSWAFGGLFGNVILNIASGVDPVTKLPYVDIPSSSVSPDPIKLNLPTLSNIPGFNKKPWFNHLGNIGLSFGQRMLENKAQVAAFSWFGSVFNRFKPRHLPAEARSNLAQARANGLVPDSTGASAAGSGGSGGSVAGAGAGGSEAGYAGMDAQTRASMQAAVTKASSAPNVNINMPPVNVNIPPAVASQVPLPEMPVPEIPIPESNFFSSLVPHNAKDWVLMISIVGVLAFSFIKNHIRNKEIADFYKLQEANKTLVINVENLENLDQYIVSKNPISFSDLFISRLTRIKDQAFVYLTSPEFIAAMGLLTNIAVFGLLVFVAIQYREFVHSSKIQPSPSDIDVKENISSEPKPETKTPNSSGWSSGSVFKRYDSYTYNFDVKKNTNSKKQINHYDSNSVNTSASNFYNSMDSFKIGNGGGPFKNEI